MQYVRFTCKLLILNISYYSKVTKKVEDLAICYIHKKYCTSIFIIYSNFLLVNSHRILLQKPWTLRWFLWCPYCPRFLYSGGWGRPTARLNMGKRSDFLLWGGRKAIMKREVEEKISRHRGLSGTPSTCELRLSACVHLRRQSRNHSRYTPRMKTFSPTALPMLLYIITQAPASPSPREALGQKHLASCNVLEAHSGWGDVLCMMCKILREYSVDSSTWIVPGLYQNLGQLSFTSNPLSLTH